jgi:glycerophosphoryl diester phosphodiesterase
VIRPRLGWRLPRVFAHRCGGALAPENTLAGLRIAARMGVRAVEFDVMLSADASPWLLHDETLERTTNGVGRVCETRDANCASSTPVFASTRHLPASRCRRWRRPPLLCRQLGLLANVEIKPAAGFEALTGEVVARAVRDPVGRRGIAAGLVVFGRGAGWRRARRRPELPLGALYERPPADWLARIFGSSRQ